jgi:hypothetical protein
MTVRQKANSCLLVEMDSKLALRLEGTKQPRGPRDPDDSGLCNCETETGPPSKVMVTVSLAESGNFYRYRSGGPCGDARVVPDQSLCDGCHGVHYNHADPRQHQPCDNGIISDALQ